MKVVRITEDQSVLWPLLVEAAKSCKYLQPEAVATELLEAANNPLVGLWVGIEDTELVACGCVMIPNSVLMELPQVPIIFNKGRHETCVALTQQMVEFTKAAGYNKFLGINRADASDDTVMRLFAHVGFVKPVGTVLEYEF